MVGANTTLPNQHSDMQADVFDGDCTFHLIDFGFASRYLDKETHQHLDQVDTDLFQGNLIFSSLNQLNFKSTSRRDDLISLAYMMALMLHEGKLPGVDISAEQSQSQSYNNILRAKQ